MGVKVGRIHSPLPGVRRLRCGLLQCVDCRADLQTEVCRGRHVGTVATPVDDHCSVAGICSSLRVDVPAASWRTGSAANVDETRRTAVSARDSRRRSDLPSSLPSSGRAYSAGGAVNESHSARGEIWKLPGVRTSEATTVRNCKRLVTLDV